MNLCRLGSARPASSFLIVIFLLLVIPFFPSPLIAADEYKQLREQLNSSQPLDTQLVETLPEPSNAEEYQLRAKVRDRISEALADLDRALELTGEASDSLVRDWIELALLAEPSPDRLDRLAEKLDASPSRYGGEIWLLSGKYAAYHNNFDRALRWTNRAMSSSSIRSEALLDRAYYQLKNRGTNPARRSLDRFLLEDSGSFRPRYWNLRGRVSAKAGSDSEAYIAHNQVVRNYPDSLEISEAELRLADLPLPEAFKPGSDGSLSTKDPAGSTVETEEEATDSSPEPGDWKIQLGSFQDRARAESFQRRMESRLDQDLTITPAKIDGQRYFRVQIIGFTTRQEATHRSEELGSRGIDSFLLK